MGISDYNQLTFINVIKCWIIARIINPGIRRLIRHSLNVDFQIDFQILYPSLSFLFARNVRISKFASPVWRALSVECLRALKIKSDLDKTSLRPSLCLCSLHAHNPFKYILHYSFILDRCHGGWLGTRKRVASREAKCFQRQRATNTFRARHFFFPADVFHDFHDFFPPLTRPRRDTLYTRSN